MNSKSRIPAGNPSFEVDLFTLFQAVWNKKSIIIATSALCGIAALGYAYFVTPEYQVSSILRPAAINELDALNRSGVYTLPPKEALLKVGSSLESYETRLSFFKANQALFSQFKRPGRTLEQSFEDFNRDSLKLILPDPTKADSLNVSIGLELNYPKGVDGVQILNGFVDHAITAERDQISADLKVIVNNRLTELKGKIDAARSNYETEKQARIATLLETDNLKRAQLQDELKALRQQLKTGRMDRMAQLSEAIGIAKALGIQKPTTPSALGDSARPADSSLMRTEINNQQIPLYFLGVEALEAERAALKNRSNDDFTENRIAQIARELLLLQSNREVEVLKLRQNEDLFLSGVEPLRAEIVRLGGVSNLDFTNLKLVSIDRKALEPVAPIKPKKALITLLGLVLGALFGILIVIAKYFVAQRRDGLHQPLSVQSRRDPTETTGAGNLLQKDLR
ncbi:MULTISPECIES: Wzz/FepE/Etk N-terminal domain-containing protein [Pseudomonas]|uniref:Wzz/FepE/Etk N-terminal domain-containing protein n=1 Tax=Pseudomonas TaxID=286 RepID=UPI0015AEF7FB|nr:MULTISPECIES: Wzz/FepE/Etk N-terminal domain-containing protein [Pseudomonas]MDN5390354.1 Wzz/FepE/Etk N-terminal domain-containing protein [Pseudomonas sp.]MDN5392919.1 Wzz/FepE/Etk N-terminal domain-containing protein [Pseudomonas sp.]MDN5404490.1 Wzz/FepE/Etk N-terminal domain-containing protein [Pseudomonas sp.]MDN5452000.1 Wzz/FepE/Etk N-terminal domain-containing protein [Pseudomonas sp.]MDN5456090.1 Wzz/FepE/Etk N-terminal domain-containing protein [Pseudomonas sp.]